jgi:hypothetical protein
MTDNPSLHEQGGEPTPGRAVSPSKSRKTSLKAPAEQLAPAPANDGDSLAVEMSGEDFYHAACVEAHRLLNLP